MQWSEELWTSCTNYVNALSDVIDCSIRGTYTDGLIASCISWYAMKVKGNSITILIFVWLDMAWRNLFLRTLCVSFTQSVLPNDGTYLLGNSNFTYAYVCSQRPAVQQLPLFESDLKFRLFRINHSSFHENCVVIAFSFNPRLASFHFEWQGSALLSVTDCILRS